MATHVLVGRIYLSAQLYKYILLYVYVYLWGEGVAKVADRNAALDRLSRYYFAIQVTSKRAQTGPAYLLDLLQIPFTTYTYPREDERHMSEI